MTVPDGAAVAAFGAFGAWLGHMAAPFLKTLLGHTKRPSRPPPPAPDWVDKLEEVHDVLAPRTDTGGYRVLELLAELPKIRALLERMVEHPPRPPFGSNHPAA